MWYKNITSRFFAVLCKILFKSILKIQDKDSLKKYLEDTKTRMWANAQPDGRPAEHRWRPLFNAPKFG